ncbi:unnamed protein product, partial [Symbiodinium sp. CCMP2456]
MQPLLYLCVRGIITWFLYKERRFRTFSASTGSVLSCGAAHSWAVSYALVAALVLHAARLSTKGWNAQLPWFLRLAEQLTFVCGIVWWFAGVLLTIIRSLRIDQEGMGLPLDQKESIIPRLIALSQNRRNKDFIALAHRLSFGCIFLCILMLCLGIFSLGTSVSSSELAASLVALCFCVPHAALAVQNLGWTGGSEMAFRAAASEAAMLAPQFTVIIACADAAGPASWWQAVLRLASWLLFAAALVVVAWMPPRLRPPSVWEMLESVALDVIAFAMITLSMPHVHNDGMIPVMLVFVVLCILCINFRETRAIITEFVEPIVPFLATEVSEPPPAHLREALRRSAHGLFVINSLLMLRQAMQHHVAQSRAREIDDQWKPPEAESWDYRPEPELERAEDSDYFGEYADSESSMMPSQGDLMWVDSWPITLAMRWRSEGAKASVDGGTQAEPCDWEHWYPGGQLLQTDKTYNLHYCWEECDRDSRCHFWDYGLGTCSLRGDAGGGREQRAGHVGGASGCLLQDSTSEPSPDAWGLMSLASRAMGIDEGELVFRDFVLEGNLLLFGPHGFVTYPDEEMEVLPDQGPEASKQQEDKPIVERWQQALQSPQEDLAKAVVTGPAAFPASLSAKLCKETNEHSMNSASS